MHCKKQIKSGDLCRTAASPLSMNVCGSVELNMEQNEMVHSLELLQ
jgi:hypothetical protein